MISTAFAHKAETTLKQLIVANLPADSQLYLFGSRARGTAKWNADYDVLVNTDYSIVDRSTIIGIQEAIDESWIPFKVDLITADQCTGVFGEQVKQQAKRW